MKHHIIIRMTHTLAWLLLLCVGVTVLGCSPHEHDWIEASCTEPFHCEGCAAVHEVAKSRTPSGWVNRGTEGLH